MVFFLTMNLLSGCSIFYTPGMNDLEKLCKKDGGIIVYKKVGVAGYFDDTMTACNGCWIEIIRGGFDFIELKYTHPTPYHLLSKPGSYHRVFKASKDDRRCNEKIWRWELSKMVGSDDYDEFFSQYCIASEPISAPAAQYGYFEESKEWKVNDWYGSTIGRFYAEIRDLSSGEIIGERTTYHLSPWPKSDLAYGKIYDCHDIGLYKSQKGSGSYLPSAVFERNL